MKYFKKQVSETISEKLNNWLFQRIRKGERNINNKEEVMPYNYMSNKIDNRKYNVFTFLPLFLYNEYKYFSNFYFLFVALIQLYEPFRVGLIITYVGPIVIVTGLSLIKEMWDEYKKSQKDTTYNHEKYM